MNKRARIILIVLAVAVAAYLAYRWWSNRQSNSSGSGLGANLNSTAPEMVAGSTGPNSGLNYYGGSTPIVIDLPNGNQSQNDTGNQDDDNEGAPPPSPPPPGEPCPRGMHRGKNGVCVKNKKGKLLPIDTVRHPYNTKGGRHGKKLHAVHEGNFNPSGGFP